MRVRVEGGTRDQQFILILSICGCFISSEGGAGVSEVGRRLLHHSPRWTRHRPFRGRLARPQAYADMALLLHARNPQLSLWLFCLLLKDPIGTTRGGHEPPGIVLG